MAIVTADELTEPQRRALDRLAATDRRNPGRWQRPPVFARSNTLESLERRGLLELRYVLTFAGAGYRARVTAAGRELAA